MRAAASRSILLDASIAAVALAAAELEVLLRDLGPGAAALALLASLPLALRRRMPVTAFVTVAVAVPTLDRLAGDAWGGDANALVYLVLAAAYGLGAYATSRRSLLAVLGAAAWLALLEALESGEDYAFVLLLLGVPWLSGCGVRRYRERAERLRSLADQLRAERAIGARVAVARERQRMAHEAHDAIAHAVSEMAVQASGAEQILLIAPERARRALTAVQETGRAAVDDLRTVVGILRDTGAPADPNPAVAVGPARRAPRWTPRLDPVLAFALLAVGLLQERSAPALLLTAAAAGAVALRGVMPLAALALALVAYASGAARAGGDAPTAAVLAAALLTTYSAAAHTDRRGALLAAPFAICVPAAVSFVAAGADAPDVLLPAAFMAIPWFAGRAAAAYARQGEELARLTERLARERDARTRLAVIEERSRVARELHDSVAHAISVMVLQAGAAEQILDGDPRGAGEALRAVQAIARDALDQLATLLGVLEPGDAPPPLAPRPGLDGLERLVASLRQAGLPARLQVVGTPEPLPAAVDGAAFRVIQEALTNALKHAGAAPTTVTVRYAADGLHIDVIDEGDAPAASREPAGFGLLGMRERVAREGGVLQAGARAGGVGFGVSAFLPVDRVSA